MEHNSQYDKSLLKSRVKEELKEFSIIYIITTCVLGFIILIGLSTLVFWLTNGKIDDWYDETPLPIMFSLFGAALIISRKLVVRYVKGQCIKHLIIERQRGNQGWAQNRTLNSPSILPEDENDELAAYHAYLEEQKIYENLVHEADQEGLAQRAYNEPIYTHPSSEERAFQGLDGQFYTKDQNGYIRKEGSSEIIGQNGYDNDGHRIDYY